MEYKVLKEKDGGKFIATIDASKYGVDPEGIRDSTEALQKAIDDCRAAGGGTVFLSAGRYALYGELTIRTSVMLHGEEGTVICCYYGRGTAEGIQIRMEACTGLIEMVLYHPEQDMECPVPYPPTVRQQGSNSITVERVTFVNPWIGIQCGPDANELHLIKKVKMSPLYQGVFMDMTTDIGRMQELSVSPIWYERFLREEMGSDADHARKLAGMAADYMFTHATGIYMARSDWEYGNRITVAGCKTGLLVTSGQDIGPNAQFTQLNITGCEIGIHLHCGNPYGIAVTDSWISSGVGKMKTAIQCDDTFDSVLQCYGVEIKGEYEHLIYHEGSGQLSFVECSFAGKAVNLSGDGIGADVLQKAGGLSLLNVQFSQGGTHVEICNGAGGAQIVGCRVTRAESEGIVEEKTESQPCPESGNELCLDVQQGAEEMLLYEPTTLELSRKKSTGYLPYPYSAEPENGSLYVVTQFGAAGDGVTDDTEAFETALAQADVSGGYVYVPGGRYRITRPLKVPQGVELRGTAEVPCHTMGGGSVILVCCGQGEEEGGPFLTLSGNCGVRGIVLYHPGQNPIHPCVYPWTVRSAGNRCYVIDTVFVNAWKGIDFGSVGGKDHYISYVSGAPIRCGIFAGKNEGGIWIENVQYNPHYWYRCGLPGRPEGDTWKEFWHNQIKYLDAFLFGANQNLNVLNTFVFAAKNGVRFVEQNGRGSAGTVTGHGTDGGECGIRIDGLENVEFVNTELVTIESPNRRIYLRNAGKGAEFYNTLMWGAPDTAVLSEGGELKMIQTNIVDSGETAIIVEDGAADIAATHFYRREKQIMVKAGNVRYLANMARKGWGGGRENLSPTDVETEGGRVTERYNWYK